MNTFPWRMARREMRGSIRHFIFFLFCIALGVGSLVGVGNVSSNLDQTIRREARNLLAADLEIRGNHPLPEEKLKTFHRLESEGISLARITELTAMAVNPDTGSSQLVELKAVDPGYPFYGRLITDPPLPDPSGLGPHDLLVQEALLVRLHLKMGDPVKIGHGHFTIRGILLKEPDRIAGTFSLGPRALITQEGLTDTGLIQPMSRVRYRYLLKIPPSVMPDEIKQRFETMLADSTASVRTYQEAQPSLANFLKRLGTYLGMVGLITLIVGGIGVANGIRVFLKQKLDTIAILKCLGGSSGVILRIYLIQALILGILGSLLGVLIGFGVSEVLRRILQSTMGSDIAFKALFVPALRGFSMGLLTTLLFTIWPLMAIRKAPPFRLFRCEVEDQERASWDWASWATVTIFTLGLGAVAMWQAGSFKLGMLFIGTFAAAFILLRGGSWLVMQLMKVLPRMRSLAFRQGLANLGRPGNQTHTIVFSIGLGVTIILTIYLVQISLIREISDNIPTDAPSLFFIDIQPDQKNPFETLLTHQGSTISHTITPIVRSRLHSINGKTIAGIADDKPNRWYFTREYVLTFQKDMPIHNTIKKGKWWKPEGYGGRSLISVEEDAARGLGIDLGSTIVFDIQGTLVQATVSSIRGVDWGSMTTNFYIIFSPGALDRVPMNYIATARLPRAGEMKLQDAIVHSFPNVTAINLRDILETVAGILNRMSQVIRFIAVFSVLAGLIVLSSAISATRLQRIRESVILKTLGATRWMLIRSFAVEYALLGAIGGTIGAGLSLLVAWSVVHYILELHWYFSPPAVLMGILTTILLTLLTGFLTTYRILGQKPLAVLRTE